mgnify:CR=1 FL=1|tara:strand:- start:742 stop:1101 length:360 start_codon:yes stop_codon:yes gene_type:complete
MKKGLRVQYEWCIEINQIDDDGDVMEREPFHYDEVQFPEILNEIYFEEDYPKQKMIDELCLVRDVWCFESSWQSSYQDETRTWAYIETKDENGKWILPEHFDDGVKVPKRFHNELSKIQ